MEALLVILVLLLVVYFLFLCLFHGAKKEHHICARYLQFISNEWQTGQEIREMIEQHTGSIICIYEFYGYMDNLVTQGLIEKEYFEKECGDVKYQLVKYRKINT